MRTVLALAALAACHHASAPPPAPVVGNTGGSAAPHQPLASLSRTACYGWCPVYTVTVYRDGVVEYDGEEFVKTKGKATGQITLDKVAAIDKLFTDASYLSLKDAYNSYDVTDNPSATTSWTHDGKTKTVDHYYGDTHAPAVLETVEDGIDKLVGIERWIGTEKEREASFQNGAY